MTITCDIRECTAEACVDIVPGIGGLIQACDRHGAELLARDLGARVYPMPGQHPDYAVAVSHQAQYLRTQEENR